MLSRRALLVSGLSVTALAAVGYGTWPRMGAYAEEAARQRRLLAAEPELGELVRMASLAANGHNTQPWRFRVSEGAVDILPDFDRRTEVVDPDDHHLYVSLGCAAENLVIAAGATGRRAKVSAAGKDGVGIALEQGAAQENPLYEAIPYRQSTRSDYDGAPVSAEDIRRLQEAAREEGVELLIFTDVVDLETILEAVVEGNSAQMDDPAFVEELKEWIRFSPDEALARGDGLFTAASGNPVMPGWLTRAMFGLVFRKGSENDKYRGHVRTSSGVAVFVGDEADPAHWIRVGRAFQRFALQATALGLKTAHINQPVEVPSVREAFAGWLGIPDQRPDLVVRFGRAAALPMSLRRPVGEIVM